MHPAVFERPLVILALLALIVGCGALREGPSPGSKAGNLRQGIYDTPMDSVVVLDEDLARWTGKDWSSKSEIAVQTHGSRRTAAKTLETVVEIRNRTDDSISVELRTTHYDAQKLPLGDPSSWKAVDLPPQGTASYKEMSQTTTADHYLVEVRRARHR